MYVLRAYVNKIQRIIFRIRAKLRSNWEEMWSLKSNSRQLHSALKKNHFLCFKWRDWQNFQGCVQKQRGLTLTFLYSFDFSFALLREELIFQFAFVGWLQFLIFYTLKLLHTKKKKKKKKQKQKKILKNTSHEPQSFFFFFPSWAFFDNFVFFLLANL